MEVEPPWGSQAVGILALLMVLVGIDQPQAESAMVGEVVGFLIIFVIYLFVGVVEVGTNMAVTLLRILMLMGVEVPPAKLFL